MEQKLAELRNYKVINSSDKIYVDIRGKYVKFIVIDENSKLDMSMFHKTFQNFEEYVQHIIFIYTLATIQTKKLKNYQNIIRIELFEEKELKRLLCGNRFLSPHRQLSNNEETEVLQKFGKDNLPQILISDPIVRLHNFDLNSVIEITRPDGIYYRIVVPCL